MPSYSVDELLAETPLNIAAGRMNDYSLTEKDMRVALALFHQYEPKTVLDFGVNDGSTAAFLLEHCPWIKHWVGVDLRPELFPTRGIVPKQAGRLAAHDGRYSSLLTDETVDDFQRRLTELGWRFDCIIMDANHEDWATKRDTDACEPFAAKPCLWLWHDYNVDSRQAPAGRPFGVLGYIDDLNAGERNIHTPDEKDRDPWRCCSLAWENRR